ncbi:family 16 glycosylhydrolase [uncultured Paraglaciecola sp.]|uniref:glycoside hydrolase family 16 protein n=1 Tax=uncultured Paraglaciecola sp. TaxID=1765024 RepID=UPI00262569FD|nr:family 16 glycosylhydrolase [uncultured Paraglaciecola sp.]
MNARVGDQVDYDGYPIERLAFEETFMGASLDTNKWHRQFRWGKNIVINGEEQIYDDGSIGADVLRFEGTHTTLRCIPTPPELAVAATANDKGVDRQMPYISAVLSTYDLFHIGESRAEIEIWLPGTNGTFSSDGAFPAFWRQGQFFTNGGYGKYAGKILTELDDMEWTGNKSNEVHFSTHEDPGAQGKLISSGSAYDTGGDLRGAWHKFGSEVEGDKVTFMLDDQWVFEKPRPRSWEETMFFNLNLAVSDGETGFGDKAKITNNSVFPMEMKVRNMRVWPIAKAKGKVYRVPTGITKQISETTAGVPICHKITDRNEAYQQTKTVEQSEIFVPYLDGGGNEQSYTGNRGDLYNLSNPGDANNPKEVIWSLSDHQNAIIFAHRHMNIRLSGAVPGTEYTIVVSRVQHAGIDPSLIHPLLKLPKAGLDAGSQFADDAYVSTLYRIQAHDSFLLLTSIQHY